MTGIGKETILQTPYYHISESDLIYDIELLKTSLASNWGSQYVCGYSVKTNSLPWLLAYLKKSDFMAEVVSEEEYKLVRHLGYPIDRIIYNGPIKDRTVFEEVLLGQGILNMDSTEEPLWLKDLCDAHPDRIFPVGIRMNCDLQSECPEEQLASEDGGRFGYCYENGSAANVIEQIKKIPNARLAGLHLHSSTQSRTPNVYGALARMAVRLAREYDLDLTYIDMGGGYFGGRDDKPSYPDYFAVICPELKQHFDPDKVKLVVEPGVSLISRCTTFVTSVLDIKDIREHRYIVTDGSRLNLNPQVTRHVYPHHFVYNNKLARRTLPTQWICGFTCMEYDRLFEITGEPELVPGDLVVYDTAGGYTMCLNPLFIKYLPAVYVTHKDGTVFQAREPWGLDEYLQKNHVEE